LIWYWIKQIIGLSSIGLNEMYCTSGVPIIDYNRKSVDCLHNPSARLQTFHSD
jgi:hypothetical protein